MNERWLELTPTLSVLGCPLLSLVIVGYRCFVDDDDVGRAFFAFVFCCVEVNSGGRVFYNTTKVLFNVIACVVCT